MINFQTWYQNHCPQQPWLIVGKGPSFKKLEPDHNLHFSLVALNHAIKGTSALIAHIADLEIIETLDTAINKNAQFLLMPWHPHVDHRSGEKNLVELIKEHPFLKSMSDQNRLLWYNSSQAKNHHPDYPVIEVQYFSFDAVASLLVSSGITEIKTLGIDGGSSYNKAFADLDDKTLLANGRVSFNDQFIAVAQILEASQATILPLGEEPVRVFIGSMPDQWLAARVLEFSIRWRSAAGVEILPLYQASITIPQPKDKSNQPRTPFSFQRFLIPELCHYKGRGIYLDSDMQVFTDIRDLGHREMNGRDILSVWDTSGSERRPQFSVMLMNCENLRWNINNIVNALDDGSLSYNELMYDLKIVDQPPGELEPGWNSLEHYQPDETKLIHYTDMNQQPWLSRNNPNGHLWLEELAAARRLGFISKQELKQQVTLGHIRPSIVYQLATGNYDSQTIPRYVRWIDKLFKPPHKQKGVFWRSKIIKYILGATSYRLARLLAG